MLKNLTQLANLLRNAHQLSPKIQQARSDLRSKTIVKRSSCNAVAVIMNGLGQVQKIEIAAEAFSTNEKDSIQLLIQQVMNEGIQEARKLHIESVRQLMGTKDLPAIDKLLRELETD
ncbi:MAG: YbaB/EbfC family nucleoid-associated protein [Pirellulales bacterium]